jgi:hypothetical protein
MVQKLSLIDKKTDDVLSKNDVVKLPIASGASFDSYKDEDNARCLHNTRVALLEQIMTVFQVDKSTLKAQTPTKKRAAGSKHQPHIPSPPFSS